jgi:hypothetical protein
MAINSLLTPSRTTLPSARRPVADSKSSPARNNILAASPVRPGRANPTKRRVRPCPTSAHTGVRFAGDWHKPPARASGRCANYETPC